MSTERRPRIAVVIPALDEEQAIGLVVAAIPKVLEAQVVVVDNGSRDRTAEVATLAGAQVVHEDRRGYGSACRAGVDLCSGAEVIVFLDADYADDPSEITRLVAPLLRDEADLVLGRRRPIERGAMGWHQVLGNRLVTTLIGLLFGVWLADLGPLRAIRRDSLLALGVSHPTYGWPVEMVVASARRGYRILEVPVTYRRRIGQSKVSGTVRGTVLAAFHMLAVVVSYAVRGR